MFCTFFLLKPSQRNYASASFACCWKRRAPGPQTSRWLAVAFFPGKPLPGGRTDRWPPPCGLPHLSLSNQTQHQSARFQEAVFFPSSVPFRLRVATRQPNHPDPPTSLLSAATLFPVHPPSVPLRPRRAPPPASTPLVSAGLRACVRVRRLNG